MNKLTQWVKSHKPHTAGLAVAIIAVISLSVAGATGVFSVKPADTASDKPAATAKVPTKAEKAPLKIDVSADDKVTESSTPTIVHVQSTDERSMPVDFYHAVDSGKKTDTVQVTPGDYKISATGVINNDGSVAKPVAESKEIAVSVKSTDKKDNAESKTDVNVKLDNTIPADQVTADDVKEIADTTKVAIENGDSSLKGDAGKAILSKVENNTNANTHLSEDTKATVTESTSEAQASTGTEAKPTVAETPAPASQPSASTSNSNESASEPNKVQTWIPEKGHWENTTEKIWIPNVVTVTDKPAWDERIKIRTKYVCSDGFTTYSDAERSAHDLAMLRAGTPVSYTWYHEFKTVHHDAVTHTEDRGYYEDKVTGRKWVVDEAGHYE